MRVDELRAALRSVGARTTAPRVAVWHAVQQLTHHATAEELAAAVGEGADAASVYRTLALFEELGLVRSSRLAGASAAVWERAHAGEHVHLVCTACGRVEHHPGELLQELTEHVDADHGFAVAHAELTVRGSCRSCRT